MRSMILRYCAHLGIVTILVLSGCHSAFFQTAKIRNGVDASIGLTKVRAADQSDVSDYSIFVKGEVGRAARRSCFGYSFALSFVSPFKTMQREFPGKQEWDTGTFPNESAGVLPELKLQFPRRLPVDIALDLRFMAIYPERLALLASEDIAEWLTLYQACGATNSEGVLLCLGGELEITKRVSLLIEGTRWLSEHQYPNDYRGPARRYPYSLGIAVSYHIPRQTKQQAPREYAQNWDRLNLLGSELKN